MKKIILLSVIAISMLNAIENMQDIDPHGYTRSNLTIEVTPMTSLTKIDNSPTTNINNFSLGMFSKAPLKTIHYKRSEIFWQGGGKFNFYKKSSDEIKNINFNIETGYTTHVNETFLFSLSTGLTYEYNDISKLQISSQLENSSESMFGAYVQCATGLKFRKYSVSTIVEYGIKDQDTTYFGMATDGSIRNTKVSIPLQYNISKNTAVILKPKYENIKSGNSINISTYSTILNFTWLYGF